MKAYSALLNGVPFTAEKPIVVLGWPGPGAANEFDTRWEALRFVEAALETDEAFERIHIYEFVANQWQHLPLRLA